MKELERDLAIYSGNIIRSLRTSKGYTQKELGDKIGVSNSAVANYEKGYRAPLQDTLFRLAEVFDVSVNYFFPKGIEAEKILSVYSKLTPPRQIKVYECAERQLEEQKQTVEVYGQTAAGDPIEYGDTYIEEKEVSYIPNGAEVALIINGDSMEPDFPNGSIVFYKKQPQVENGQIAIVEVDGGVTCKRIKFDYENEKVILQSLNEVYEDQVFEDDDVKVLGLVVQ